MAFGGKIGPFRRQWLEIEPNAVVWRRKKLSSLLAKAFEVGLDSASHKETHAWLATYAVVSAGGSWRKIVLP